MISKLKIASLILLAALLVAIPLYLQSSLAGEKPSLPYDEYMKNQNRASSFDDNLKALAKAAETAPNDIATWKKFANALANKVYSSEDSTNQGNVIELIDALRHILDLDPNDPETLISMANINYNFQVFDKAAEFFDRYLKINKDDHLSRATYGSALSFLGQFDSAEKELLYVIAKEPSFFLARANLAITYALSGDKDLAKKTAAEAKRYAKDEQTRARFDSFLEEILNPKPQTEVATDKAPTSPVDPSLAGIEADIRGNPVAGPKFVFAKKQAEGVLELNFANFPMKGMPPFAKEKFFASIRESISRNNLSEIQKVTFVDHATNETMDILSLK